MSHYRVTSAGSAYPLEALTGRVVGAAIEVHKELGPGYVEATYEDALAVELTLRGILSFGPDTPALELQPLNVLIGRNTSSPVNRNVAR